MGLTTSQKILIIILALLAFGLIMVYSSSYFKQSQDGFFYLKKQMIMMGIGLTAMIIAMRIPYQFWAKISPILMLITWGLLILVRIPGIGHIAGGARRWLKLGPLGFQPSELAKIVLVIFIAGFISRYPEQVKSFKKGFIPLSIATGFTVLLIMVEPDIGTSVFIILLAGILLMIGGLKLRYIIPVGAIGVTLMMVAVILFYPHAQSRLNDFLHPSADIAGKGYQKHQALIGLGAGGLTGSGLGLSYQKLYYLPQQHTDFILAIVGEELGFAGALTVILLFLAILFFGRKLSLESPDKFGSLLAIGIGTMIVLQALINMAVVTALMPTKGISLPLISYGGSGLLVTLFAVGIFLNIARQSEKNITRQEAPPERPNTQIGSTLQGSKIVSAIHTKY